MSLVLIDLIIQISMDLFSEKSHMLLNSFLNFLVDQESNSISQIVGNFLELIFVWSLLIVGLLLQLMQLFLGSRFDRVVSYSFWGLSRSSGRGIWWWHVLILSWWSLINWLWLLDSLLLHLKFSQLTLSVLNFIFCLIDIVILSIDVVK